jgi:hypothetical protein
MHFSNGFAPEQDIIDDKLHAGMMAGIKNEFQLKTFFLSLSKTANLLTMLIPLQALITRGRRLCPRTIYFRDDNFLIGITAGIGNEFQA